MTGGRFCHPTTSRIAPALPTSTSIPGLYLQLPLNRNGRRAATGAMSSSSPPSSSEPTQHPSKTSANGNRDSDANIRNFAPVARIMKSALPENAKIAKEAKECMQECVSEFISFITSEGAFLPFSRKHASFNSFSVGEMPAGEAQDGQRRRHLVRNDFAGLRKLLGGVEDLSRSLSRGKHPSQTITTPTRRHPEGSVEILNRRLINLRHRKLFVAIHTTWLSLRVSTCPSVPVDTLQKKKKKNSIAFLSGLGTHD